MGVKLPAKPLVTDVNITTAATVSFMYASTARAEWIIVGKYNTTEVVFNPNRSLSDLREQIARCRHRGMHDACMVHYVGLLLRR
jgi:hypothetical protein